MVAPLTENEVRYQNAALAEENERLTERCAAYKGQVEAGSHEIERLLTENESLKLTLIELNANKNLRLG